MKANSSQQHTPVIEHEQLDAYSIAQFCTRHGISERIDADPQLATELANVTAWQKALRGRFPRATVSAGLRSHNCPCLRWLLID